MAGGYACIGVSLSVCRLNRVASSSLPLPSVATSTCAYSASLITMSLGPWNSFDFGPSTFPKKVACALAEMGFYQEDPGALDARNLFSIRYLPSFWYATHSRVYDGAYVAALEEQELEMKIRDAEAGRVASCESRSSAVSKNRCLLALALRVRCKLMSGTQPPRSPRVAL